MSISVNTCWEVRPTNGSDTNGGGFVAGATGTDWSQQNAAQYSVTDAVTAGTTTITSATASFGTDVVGNILYIQGGTAPITAGWYQIVTRTNATTIVVDRATGLTAGTGATLNIGGAFQTITQAVTVNTLGNKVFVKAEATISISASINLNNNQVPTATAPLNVLTGYTSTRTDGGRVTIQHGANSLTGISTNGNAGWRIENFYVDCNSKTGSTGIRIDYYSVLRNCKVANFTGRGIYCAGNYSTVCDNEVTTGGTGDVAIYGGGVNTFLRNYVHDNQNSGLQLVVPGCAVLDNIFDTNTGATTDGITMSSEGDHIICNNVFYANGRDGIRCTNQILVSLHIYNNIFVSNAGYGINAATAGSAAQNIFDGNAFYNNTSGARHNIDDTTTNPVNGVSPYTNTLDVTLTGDPFTNAAGGDFTLNNTAGAGAACRAVGRPASITGATGTAYPDMGTFQHQDTAPVITNISVESTSPVILFGTRVVGY